MDTAGHYEFFEELSRNCHVPRATYRLQFNRSFTFKDATQIVDYLRELGVSDVYASPIFQARSASTHGYDICDFNQFSSNLGGDGEFKVFSDTLRTQELGLILDMVPNHMGIGEPANHWWIDVLENGPSAAHAESFDIHWADSANARRPQVMLPILGDHFGKVLEKGELQIGFDAGSFFLAYYETKLPLSPASYRVLLRSIAETALSTNGKARTEKPIPALIEVEFKVPLKPQSKPHWDYEHQSSLAELKNRLCDLHRTDPDFQSALDAVLKKFNGAKGNPASFNRLEALLRKQYYRLVYWRLGSEEINYRRFFDITDLAAVRMESYDVFKASHQLIQRLMRESRITGLRIDHPDGLWDPAQYFSRLQSCFLIQNTGSASNCPEIAMERAKAAKSWIDQRRQTAASARPEWPFYVVAEKILSGKEELPRDWTLDGTTGYETLNLINGLFVRNQSEAEFSRIYRDFIGRDQDYSEEVLQNKRRILRTSLSSELRALARSLTRVTSNSRHGSDFSLSQLESGLTELLAVFPVYRSYVTEETRNLSETDTKVIQQSIEDARNRADANLSGLFDFLASVMLLRRLLPHSKTLREQQIEFIMRFQQLAGPAMAKGLEDTTFYRYNRLISLNEVGGHPDHFGVSLDEFHDENSKRLAHWPNTLIATATHDTKRGEDVRARINVLSEIPEAWERAVHRWRDFNSGKKEQTDGREAPDKNEEYLFYQTLIGMWPAESERALDLDSIRDRVAEYMLKASKEAKVNTSWTDPNSQYEDALRQFVFNVLDGSANRAFLSDFVDFQKRIAFFGALNSLSQTLLKLTLPGIPDFYQGTELWDLSLVDPDNRRPVDYTIRRKFLEDLRGKIESNPSDRTSLAGDLLADWRSGRIKQYLIHCALQFRRDHAKLFSAGDYVPLRPTGAHAQNVCAFARILDGHAAIVVVPRFLVELTGDAEALPVGEAIWKDSRIDLWSENPFKIIRNVLTGETLETDEQPKSIAVGRILRHFPVALLDCQF